MKGTKTIMSVRDAVNRATQINAMFPGDPINTPLEMRPHAAKAHRLVQKIADACREAQRQKETGNKGAMLTTNMIAGLTPDGKQLKSESDEDKKIQMYTLMFPTLGFDDVRVILRDDKLDKVRQEQFMNRLHTQNMEAKYNFSAIGKMG